MDIQPILDNLKKTLLSFEKEKILGIATTADRSNPPFILGSVRETGTTIAGTIILRETSLLDQIVENFDGVVDYFMVDCEVKNELQNLESLIFRKVKKSKIFIYKPNDFTVESLDFFVALLFPSLINKRILIVGAGNIGSKTALKLCERGANIFLHDLKMDKVQKIIEGLNIIKRSKSTIYPATQTEKDYDLVLGCTPGIPAIDKSIVESISKGGKIIDVGNRTIFPEAISHAQERDIEVLSLSSLGGYRGMIENWLTQREFFNKTRKQSQGGFSVIIPGVLGSKGDVLVDDIASPSRVFGICDGVGGLLPNEEGRVFLDRYLADNGGMSNIKIIHKLYQ